MSLWKTSNRICQNRHQKIPVCKIDVLMLKFTVFTDPQKKLTYLSSTLPESPCWNPSVQLKCICSYPINRAEVLFFDTGNKHRRLLIQGSFSSLHLLVELYCWTALHTKAHPRVLGFLSQLHTSCATRVVEKCLQGVSEEPLLSAHMTWHVSSLTYAISELLVACFEVFQY